MEKQELLHKYSQKIDPLLHKLLEYAKQGRELSPAQLSQAQTILIKIADNFQTRDSIGKDLYKIYLSQALIYYQMGDARAKDFIKDAKGYSVNKDVQLAESIIKQRLVASNEEQTLGIKDIDAALAIVKKDAKKSIWIGLGLILLSLVITIISYNMASAGGTYVVFWGFALFGIIIASKGFYAFSNPASKLDKQIIREYPNISRTGSGIVITLVGIAGIVVCSLIVLAIFSPDLSQELESSAPSTATYEDNFVAACVEQGADTQACSCIARYMTTHYSMDRLIELESEVDATSSTTPTEIDRAISACV